MEIKTRRSNAHGNQRSPHECAKGTLNAFLKQELRDLRQFTHDHQQRHEYDHTQQVGVPTQVERAPTHDVQSLLDHHGVNSGDTRREYSERDTDDGERHRIKEHPYEEAKGDDSAGGEDGERGARVQEHKRGSDCEREDETSGNLIEGCVDIFQSIVAQTAMGG